MNKRPFVASAFVLFLFAANAVGQQSPPPGGASTKEKPASLQKEKDDVVRISVTLVQVDAVVTDDKGQPVFASGDVHLRLTSLFGHDSKTGAYVRSLLHIELKNLTFTDQPDGSHESIIDVAAVTFSDNGQIVQQEARTYTLRVPAPQFERLMQRGFLYSINLPVKKAGAYQY